MTRDLRWRIISLQVLMIVVLGFGAGAAIYASNFTQEQIRSQLAPQQIFFPTADKGLPAELSHYAGQQVLNGNQAHAYADQYIGLHLREMADGKPYSVLSSEARAEKDPALKAEKEALVQTAFRGETLRAILNQAWAFGTIGEIAMYVGYGLIVATLLVAAALVFELFFAPRREAQAVRVNSIARNPA